MLAVYWHHFLVPYKAHLLKGIACFLVASGAGLCAPVVVKVLIDEALERGSLDFLSMIVAGIALLYLIRGLFFFWHGLSMAKAGNRMIADMRSLMFCQLQSQDYAYFVDTSPGETMSLFTNDLFLLQQAVTIGIPDLIVECINLVAIIGIMVYLDLELALVTFVTLPFIILAISCFNKKIAGFGSLLEQSLAKLTEIIHQSLRALPVIQSYVREDYEADRINQKIREAAYDYFKLQRVNAILIPLVEFLAAIGLTIIIWYGGKEVISGDLTIGGMFAFLIYVINMPAPVRKISEAIAKLKLGEVAWKRINLLDNEPKTVIDGSSNLPMVTGKLEFRNVTFNYQTKMGILKNVSIRVESGEIVAIVGPSGAGKSSFANLLLRLYDPNEGAIYLDDIDIRNLKINELRSIIGFIQQEPILFNASIAENIRYGRSCATFEEVVSAAKLAGAHDFIMELPRGYDSGVGQYGNSLSGGQRQRIALARSIILDPKILLLDEPTASLDAESEKQVMEAIRHASKGRTTFIITHRLSTLMSSDKVIYVVDGQVVEMGRQEDLLNKNGFFARAVHLGGEM